MSPIKDFTMRYEALNPESFFSQGDTITGTVTVTLTKDTKVKSLFLKAKGDARVRWTDVDGEDVVMHRATKRYFKVKEYLVSEAFKDTVLPRGVNHFKFNLTIPLVDMPSSFKGRHGKIVYTLEAKLSRSWQWPLRRQCEIRFFFKYGSVNKDMGIFSKREVKMFATVDRRIYSPGDTVSVFVNIHNSSSKQMKPKFSLRQETMYSTRASTKTCDTILCKMVGNKISAKSQEMVSCQLKIPDDTIYTVVNSELVSVQYYLKVYLDISFATDPEVVFPLVIAPSSIANVVLREAVETNPAGASGGPS
ncbi:arrestin domain-containing protein 3-like [Hippoglossus stenolepis]|uniref:arrestin domain-containing protein 3-like n=1 Tax=Hippoglossus stenolepis TaxID=195615 RepID=UPI001FAFA78D|nr:arrestin domain-containing protein 3-like [Hippoglossus stenolepis]